VALFIVFGIQVDVFQRLIMRADCLNHYLKAWLRASEFF
jgi:hypothetical protein